MRKIFITAILSALVFTTSWSQSAEEQKAWMAFMMPGDMHKMLESANGQWNAEISFWMDANSKPETYKATCNNIMILGDRYQQSTFKGEMMGMPFEGIGTTAYDNARKVFMSTWIDNMGTSMMYSEGKYDADKKQIEFKGLSTDPATGDVMDFREVFKFVSDKKQILEMYMTVKGKEYKSMEIVLTR